MIKIIVFAIALVIVAEGIAQTNTFPSSGSVGIGTVSPGGFKLMVLGDQNAFIEAAGTHAITFTPNSSRFNRIYSDYFSGSTPLPLSLGCYGVPNSLIVQPSGNVGIGTTSPAFKLDVGNALNVTANSSTGLAYQFDGTAYGGKKWAIGDGTVVNGTFSIRDITVSVDRLSINTNGDVGVGTTSPSEKLSVNGNISTKKLIVTQTGWSDYVFNKNYKLKTLQQVEAFIKENKHLPEVPSAKEVEEKGVSVGDNQALLLKKIEELTLYVIDLQKQVTVQAKEIWLLKHKK